MVEHSTLSGCFSGVSWTDHVSKPPEFLFLIHGFSTVVLSLHIITKVPCFCFKICVPKAVGDVYLVVRALLP